MELTPSRLTSKEFIQIDGVDPSHAMLYIRYGNKYLAVLHNPNWFGEAMLKLANSNLGDLDPARVLSPIRE